MAVGIFVTEALGAQLGMEESTVGERVLFLACPYTLKNLLHQSINHIKIRQAFPASIMRPLQQV